MQDMNFMFPPEFLKKNLVTEVDVCMISSLCSTVALSIGYQFQSNSGKSGKELLEKYTETLKVSSSCEACVQSDPANLNAVKTKVLEKCRSVCQICWSKAEVCDSCLVKGRKTIYPQ